MKVLLKATCFFVLVAVIGCSDPSTLTESEKLEITKHLNEIVVDHELMGMSVELIKDGRHIYSGHFGKADYERNIPVSQETIYRIASISKTFTAASVMKLWDKGKLDLDADVSQYLGFQLRNPNFPDDVITLRHLLNHTSTVRDGAGYGQFLGKMISEQKPISGLFTTGGEFYTDDMFTSDHRVGEYFSYSNSAWGLIATAVETASGKRFDKFLEDQVFIPMEMDGRINVTQLEDINNLSVLYRFQNEKWTPQADNYKGEYPQDRAKEGYEPGHNGTLYSPQGSVRASSKDLVNFMTMFMNDGLFDGKQILSKKAVEEMIQPYWIYDGTNGDTWDNFFLSYGLGTHVLTNADSADYIFPELSMIGHPGIAYGLVSDMYVDREKDTGVVLIINGSKFGYKSGERSSFYIPEEEIFEVLGKYLK